MSDVEITIKLPEELVTEARALDLLSDAKFAELLQTELDRQSDHIAYQHSLQSQLEEMASDPEIQRELSAIENDFSVV